MTFFVIWVSSFSSSKFVADAASVRGEIVAPNCADAGCVGHDYWNLQLEPVS